MYPVSIQTQNKSKSIGLVSDDELDRLDAELRQESKKSVFEEISDSALDVIESIDWGELGKDTISLVADVLELALDTTSLASSVGLVFLGTTGSVLGGVATCTGIGAAVGVPATAVSVTAVTAGVAGLTISIPKTAGDCVKFTENLGSRAGKSYVKPRTYPDDFQTRNTVQKSAYFKTEGEARALCREKIGSDPVEISDGKLRSKNGKWQYRAKENDITGEHSNGKGHIHLEKLDPKTGEILENWHLNWE